MHVMTTTHTTVKPMRVPPQDIESEKALLGAIMLRSSSIHDLQDTIFPDSFYVEKHVIIYSAMLDLARKHDPIDLVSVSARLKEKKKLEEIGGRAYLTSLTEIVPSSANIKHYSEVVARKSVLREVIATGDYTTELGFNESDELEEILDKVEKRVFAITSKSTTAQKFTDITAILPDTKETLARLHASKDELRGVSTGFAAMDNLLAGLMPSDLIILAARPSMGKTSLALDIARKSALEHGTKVGIFSLEMSAQQLTDRMVAAEARVDSWKLRTGNALSDADMDAISSALERLENAPIYIDDQSGNTLLRMRSTARRLKSEHGLDLIIIDYLQLINPSRNYDSMVNQVTEISRSLKGLARELNVPVVALSQLSRAVESRGGKPRLSDLRDSGSIEQDADVVMFIHREDRMGNRSDEASNGIAEILVEKHRNGPVGHIKLFFNDKKTSFEELAKDDFSDYGV